MMSCFYFFDLSLRRLDGALRYLYHELEDFGQFRANTAKRAAKKFTDSHAASFFSSSFFLILSKPSGLSSYFSFLPLFFSSNRSWFGGAKVLTRGQEVLEMKIEL